MPVIPDYIPAHEQSLKLSRQNAIMLVHALDEPAKNTLACSRLLIGMI